MKASIADRIRITNLPKAKALLPLFEVVMNAFQSIEEVGGKNHAIRIVAERQGNLDEGNRTDGTFSRSDFDAGQDHYTCSGGKLLLFLEKRWPPQTCSAGLPLQPLSAA